MSEIKLAVYRSAMTPCETCEVGAEDECVPDCVWVEPTSDIQEVPAPMLLVEVLADYTLTQEET